MSKGVGMAPATLTQLPDLGLQTVADGLSGLRTDGSVLIQNGKGTGGTGFCAWPGLGNTPSMLMSACPRLNMVPQSQGRGILGNGTNPTPGLTTLKNKDARPCCGLV